MASFRGGGELAFGTFRSGLNTEVATFQGSRLEEVHCNFTLTGPKGGQTNVFYDFQLKTEPVFLPACNVPADQCFQILLAVTASQKLWLNLSLHFIHHPLLGLAEKIYAIRKGSLKRNIKDGLGIRTY